MQLFVLGILQPVVTPMLRVLGFITYSADLNQTLVLVNPLSDAVIQTSGPGAPE